MRNTKQQPTGVVPRLGNFALWQLTRVAFPDVDFATTEQIREYFYFLEALAETRKVNMLLAGRHLCRMFPELNQDSAGAILVRWWIAREPVFVLTGRNQ